MGKTLTCRGYLETICRGINMDSLNMLIDAIFITIAAIFIALAAYYFHHSINMDRRKMVVLEKCADQYPDRIERMVDKFLKS